MAPGANELQVKVVEVGGVFAMVEVPKGSTIATAMRKAGANTEAAKQITVNGVEKTKDDMVQNGDTIYIVPNIRGACWTVNKDRESGLYVCSLIIF